MRTINEGLGVATVRDLALEANINGRLTQDPSMEQLKVVLVDAQRALNKSPDLKSRSHNGTLRRATELR